MNEFPALDHRELFSRIETVGDLDVRVRAFQILSAPGRIEIVLEALDQTAIVDVPLTGNPEHIAEVALAIFAEGLQIAR